MPEEISQIIRPARPGEETAIRDLVRDAYALYVPRMGKEPGPMLDDYAQRVADGAAFVLEADSAILGIAVLLAFDDYLLLDNVAVSPAFQGQGIGRALIGFAEAEAARRGYAEIRLYTHETMVENVSLYVRLGWEETHRVSEQGYDRIYMQKRLARI